MNSFQIGQQTVGDGSEGCFIIAELSANHNNDLELAKRTIQAMADSGADAVKLQTYTPDSMTLDCDGELFMARNGTLWEGRRLHEIYAEGALPMEWHAELKVTAENCGLQMFSSPFDQEGVDFLEELGVPAYKIASLEITDIPLIRHVARKGRPVIFSTGIAELADIDLAVRTCRAEGNEQIGLLRCTSAYPTPLSEVNLATIPGLRESFGVVVGLSDHTEGSVVPVAAVALGASIIEKHFVLDRAAGGLDASFSMMPDEFGAMVKAVREAEAALGEPSYKVSEKMAAARRSARSILVTRPIKKGEVFSGENLRVLRPGAGLHPKHLDAVLGRVAATDLAFGTPLFWESVV